MQILPLHLHMHHSSSAAGPGHSSHTMDVHLATSHDDQAHHQDAHVIDLGSNSIVKTLDGEALLPLFWLCLLTLVMMPPVQRWRPVLRLADITPKPFYLAFAPLRAPPRA
jgi:hypothetical protein